MPALYSIRDWHNNFETCETKKLKSLHWWPKPNKHDGLGFSKLRAHRDRVELFCAWNLMCDIASKSGDREQRGRLIRDGRPLNAEDMALMTGFPQSIFEKALTFFSDPSQGWITAEPLETPLPATGDAKGEATQRQAVSAANSDLSDLFPANAGESAGIAGASPAEGRKERRELMGVFESAKLRVGGWFRRRPSTTWSEKEEKLLRKVLALETPEDDWQLLETFYTAPASTPDYRRRDIETLLNNWNGEIDRARGKVAGRKESVL